MARGKDVKRGDFYYDSGIDAGHYVTGVSTRNCAPGQMTMTFVNILSASRKGATVGPETTWGPSNENNEFTSWQLSALPSEAHAALVAAARPMLFVALTPNVKPAVAQQPGYQMFFGPDGKRFSEAVTRPRIEANADAGRTVCAKCGGQMKELFTSRYCPTCE
jgi:hypothetical protein